VHKFGLRVKLPMPAPFATVVGLISSLPAMVVILPSAALIFRILQHAAASGPRRRVAGHLWLNCTGG
jgi:hypothetical protein